MNNINRTFTTAHGTELPILNLKGKDYLEVKYRLVWFREEHPQWSIETSFLNADDRSATARAVVKDESGRIIATSHKAEHAGNFPDFMEKAETGAIGRALALIGYGTQFCADELDEGERIVDAPAHAVGRAPRPRGGEGQGEEKIPFNIGDFRIGFGRKYLGKKLREIPRDEIESYLDWIEDSAAKKKTGLSVEARLLKDAVERYYHPEKFAASKEGSDGRSAESGEAAIEDDSENVLSA